ncbi:phosphohistidine phosphatase SixA [candidate division CSSED10-310 bacterium]|uniref:Phosphohistidine phosphatase SixA n=1 Tax=candidate division CSSED10-310 bacterium TaxID=2855610 RepID=A0ABV6YXH4_UNCC1
MKLYLVQHGKPVPKEKNPDRPLSEQGISDVEQVAIFLKKAQVKCFNILHSGKTRAQETAEILARALSPGTEPQQKDGLAPLDDVRPIAQWLKGENEDCMLVGHLPHLGKLVSYLVVHDVKTAVASFQQGCVVCLESGENAAWTLAWMIIPQIIT